MERLSINQQDLWRHERFVERDAEIALFTRYLAEDAPRPRVLYVHGPGGIGKTSLLWELGHVARVRGALCTYLDGRHAAPSPQGFLHALAHALKLGPGESPIEALRGSLGRHVVLLDTCETLDELEGWLYDAFVAQLPRSVLLVLASRKAPSLTLRRSAGWGVVIRPVALGALSGEGSSAYLERRGVPDEQREAVIGFTHGHPLALSLCADVITFGRARAFAPERAPDVIHALVTQFIEQAPSAAHRAALDVCALLRTTTEPALAAVLDAHGADERGLFEWLRGLSFIQSGPSGLFPHDLAREVFIADLRWRNPARFSELFARAIAHYAARIEEVGDRDREVHLDFLFLQCHLPEIRRFFDWRSEADLTVGTATSRDVPHLAAMVAAHEGPESAALAERWLQKAPESALVVRDGDRPAGFSLVVMLDVAKAADLLADPGTAAVLRYLERSAPLRPGQRGLMVRFWMSGDGYQDTRAVSSLLRVVSGAKWMSAPGLSCAFHVFAEPERWGPLAASFNMRRMPDADFTVGGRTYGVIGCDFRLTPHHAWREEMAKKGVAAEAPLAPPPVPAGAVLDREAFGEALRGVLRELHSPRALSESPLLYTELVARRVPAGASPEQRAAVLITAIREAVASLRGGRRGERIHRVLEQTYLRSGLTQAQAAAELRLPFSTYRRHLKEAVGALEEVLWQEDRRSRR